MKRVAADLLVRRAERQSTRFLLWIAVGYVLGFIAIFVLLLVEGEFSHWPSSVKRAGELLGILFVVPFIFFGMVFGVIFKLRHHRSPEWRFDHAISLDSDVDMKTFDLLDAIEQVVDGGMTGEDASLVQDVLQGELAKARQAGADPICLAAYLRMRLEDHHADSEAFLSEQDCQPMLELIAGLEAT